MIERIIVGVLLLAGVVALLLGYGTVGIIAIAVGLFLGIVFYRMENKVYSSNSYSDGNGGFYIVKDRAKLKDDRE